jgi:tetratricopeptide (TPR) repeat protein
MKKQLILIISLFNFYIATMVAQQITGRAPSQVAVGEQFRLTYTVNTDDVSGFRAGNIPDAFEVLMGPSTSTQSSFQMVNGHTSSSTSVTYTYILSATKNGSFTIPAAHATVNGKSLHSNELHIKVSGTAQQGSNGGGQRPQGAGQARAAGSHISGSDLFIKVSANKSHVHEQEPILLTYKVYTLVDLTSLSGKMPDLKSFYTREVPLPQQKSFKLETLNGRPYRTVTWQQYVMFPQTTGKLEIPSITYEGMVVLQNRNVDPFEAFFNGGSGYMEVKKEIKAPGLTITVDPLPARPTNFSGGVGTFSLTATINKKEVKANDPVTFRVTVSGTGNLKLIKQPVVNLPKDFDQYDAKVTDNTKLTTNGVEGSMVYDILVVPRHQGKYEIPPVEFTYYDTQSNSYKTLRSQPFTLDVAKGDGTSSVAAYTSEEVKQLNKDIRYIKTAPSRLREVDDYFFGSVFYWISLAVLLAVFISLFIIFRHRAIENANIGKMRGKRANKVAVRRLRQADKLLKAGKQSEFYDEVLRALWGYVGDKLDMPVTQLSRENISQRLSERGVDTDTVNQFIGALDECEYARYAPGDPSGNMNKVYDAAIQAIMKIEDFLKGKKHIRRAPSTRVLMLLLLSLTSYLIPLTSHAVTKAEADSAYVHEHYQQAIAGYESLLKGGVSADLYYNLGNAYYRTDNITKAILNYERALLLSPGDADTRFNLQMARSKTIDKITPESEMFFVTWYHSLVNLMSVDAWARTALIALAIAIILALAYLFSGRIWLRKVGFFGAFFLLVVFVLSNLFAFQQKQKLTHRIGAIIMTNAATVKSTPSKNGTDLFILHEGTRVTITDGSMSGWKEIRVADGKQGWIDARQLEII